MEYQADISHVKDFLYRCIVQQADEKAVSWLNQQIEKLEKDALNRHIFLAFSTASRFFTKEACQLSSQDQAEADQLRKGFQPGSWNVLQAARIYLLLMLPYQEQERYLDSLNKLFETADMEEQRDLYAALPVLPYPEQLVHRTTEGLRTNMTTVFDAIALHNPYPADYLNENAWNQMLLKAVFMQRPLYKIYRADTRANVTLAHMLIDFAHERWAAHRKVTPELWRFVGPFLHDEYLPDIEKVVEKGEPLEVEAALLACAQSAHSGAAELLEKHPAVKRNIEAGRLNWQNIGERQATNIS